LVNRSSRRFWLFLLLLGAGISAAALAVSRTEKAAAISQCTEGGRWLSFDNGRLGTAAPEAIMAQAVKRDVVLLGEQHDLEDHHRWQLQVISALHAQRPDMVIGFEMFPRRVQNVLDRWVAGQLTTQAFLAQAEWDQVWSFPPQIYLPLFEFARINRIPMVALNIERKLTRAISEKGWHSIPVAEREGVGRAASPPQAYREFLQGMHLAHLSTRRHAQAAQPAETASRFENFLDAQITWDRAMAEALAKRVTVPDSPRRPLVVGVMGSGHLRHGHGVPHQLRDLGVQRIFTLLPVSTATECQDFQAGLADAVFVLPTKPEATPEPPRLGVAFDELGDKGLRIAQVTAGSLAEQSGLKVGDRVVELAGRPPTGVGEAIALIRRLPPGTWLPLRIARQDQQLDIVVRFPARP
jgi:uncharacterized iron-regulated protein